VDADARMASTTFRGSTSRTGRARRIASAVRSGFSASGRLAFLRTRLRGVAFDFIAAGPIGFYASLPPLTARITPSRTRRSQKRPHEVDAPASHSDTAASRDRRSMPWAQDDVGLPMPARRTRRRTNTSSRPSRRLLESAVRCAP
jgi:hypothetical protein